jgi:hypothetical protein
LSYRQENGLIQLIRSLTHGKNLTDPALSTMQIDDEQNRAPKHPIGRYYFRDLTCGCSVTVGVIGMTQSTKTQRRCLLFAILPSNGLTIRTPTGLTLETSIYATQLILLEPKTSRAVAIQQSHHPAATAEP